MDYLGMLKVFAVFFIISCVIMVFEEIRERSNTIEKMLCYLSFFTLCFAFALYNTSVKPFTDLDLIAALLFAFLISIVLGKKLWPIGRTLIVLGIVILSMASFYDTVLERITKNNDFKIELLANEFNNDIEGHIFSRDVKRYLTLVRGAEDNNLKLLEYRLLLESWDREERLSGINSVREIAVLYKEFQVFDQFLDMKTTDPNILAIQYAAIRSLRKIVDSHLVLPAKYNSGSIFANSIIMLFLFLTIVVFGLFFPIYLRDKYVEQREKAFRNFNPLRCA